MRRRFTCFCWPVLLFSIGSLAGYRMHSTSTGCLIMDAHSVPKTEYLSGPDSFSRVQNTKNELAALSLQVRLEAQSHLTECRMMPAGRTRDECFEKTLRELESAAEEFGGTKFESDLTQDLLSGLNLTHQYDKWIETYLTTLYQHPTYPTVSHCADEAMRIGRAIGREKDVQRGFTHLLASRTDLVAKKRISELVAGSSSHPCSPSGASKTAAAVGS